MGGERLCEPVASDLLGRAIVICRHHRIGPRIVGEGRRRVGGEIVDANRVVVDYATGEQGEAGENGRTHLVRLSGQLRRLSSLFLHPEASSTRSDLILPPARRLLASSSRARRCPRIAR